MNKLGQKALAVGIFLCAGLFVFLQPAHASLSLNDGTLVRGSGPEIYILDNGMKRWIPDAATFDSYEFNWSAVTVISDSDLAAYPKAQNFSKNNHYPDGMLLRGDPKGGGDGVKVYQIQGGARRWIETEQDFIRLGLQWNAIQSVSQKKLTSVREGTLLQNAQPPIRPLVTILSTPDPVVEDTTVTFRLTGTTSRQDNRSLSFQTYLEGVDSGWASTGTQRQIKLPEKSATYRFFARAKDASGVTDKTPQMYTFTVKLSPLFNQVAVSGSPRSTDPAQEQITLTSRVKDGSVIPLAGWTLGSDKYNTSFPLPTDEYEIPVQPYYQYTAPLQLGPKTKLVVYSGTSPLGVNFRLNECIGYLNVYYKATPALPNQCPRINQDVIKDLTAYCQQVIGRLGCKEPDYSDSKLDAECRDFMQKNIGYSQCVQNNHTYYDFFQDEVRAYLNHSSEIWPNESDTIILRDQNGLVAARYKY